MLESQLTLHRWYKVLTAGVIGFFGLTCLIPLVSLVFYVTTSTLIDPYEEVNLPFSGDASWTPLKDKEFEERRLVTEINDSVWIPMPNISKKLLFLEHNDRPDCTFTEQGILLGLKGSTAERYILQGERVFLNCIDREHITFSQSETPFSIVPAIQSDGKLEVFFETKFNENDSDTLYEFSEKFTVAERHIRTAKEIENVGLQEVITILEGSKLYLPDLLIEEYGGAAFEKIKGLFRLETGDDKSNVLFIQDGDKLVWQDGRLHQQHQNSRGKPLLLVNSINKKECRCLVWSGDGLICHSMVFPILKVSRPTIQPTEIFSKINFRTDSSITCQFQNKNVVLREGDWLLRTTESWHNLHSHKELKEYLRYALKGELFIFDSIEKRQDGVYLLGSLFDENRTSSIKIELPLKSKTTNKISPENKKSIPSKLRNSGKLRRDDT